MAEGDDDSQKTEDPTPKRLEEARKKGQIALSRELNTWLMLLAATIIIGTMSRGFMSDLTVFMRGFIEHAGDLPAVPGGFRETLGASFWKVLGLMALPLLALMFMAFIGPFIQTGPIFAPEVIKPDLSKISPIKGFGRLFSMRSIIEFVKGILKLAIIGAVGYLLLAPYFDKLEHMVGLPIPTMMDEILALTMRLLAGVLVVLLIVAVLDVLYQRHAHMKKMRMSKQELKDEYKQSEGDPQIKGKLRQLRAEKARQRMMANVPGATVVITNPTHYAVALKYEPETMDAPVCVAKGVDAIALKIREVATENKVTIYQNPPLARTLYSVIEIDDIVPPEHYQTVAEVISFVFRQQGKLPQ
ncbi:MAG TPA: flagellar biosynthesis protein FlhB [Micavibrio sp.]